MKLQLSTPGGTVVKLIVCCQMEITLCSLAGKGKTSWWWMGPLKKQRAVRHSHYLAVVWYFIYIGGVVTTMRIRSFFLPCVKLAAAIVVVAACCAYGLPNVFPISSETFHEGDIIFQTSRSSQSRAIQLATHSKYSHMGILFRRKTGWYVYEAVGPVKDTPLARWIARGEGGHYAIKRLKLGSELSQQAVSRLKIAGARFRGRPYDPYFEWSDNKLYCSELVWKIYKEALGVEIGPLTALSAFDLKSPEVASKLAERYGKNVPLNERVITPSAMFNSPKLVAVCSR